MNDLERAWRDLESAYHNMMREVRGKPTSEYLSAEDRVRTIRSAVMPFLGPDDHRAIAAAIRDAESAAWDRAVEAAKGRIRDSGDRLYLAPYTAVSELKGRCHEEKP